MTTLVVNCICGHQEYLGSLCSYWLHSFACTKPNQVDYLFVSVLWWYISTTPGPTCMNVGVLLHVWLLVETFPAVLARVGTGVRVDQQMCRQRGGALEALAALFTGEAAFLAVHSAMLTQTHDVTKRLVTYVTSVRTLIRVSASNVDFQPMRGAK